jgi:mono/diheme cytochrome c family protein
MWEGQLDEPTDHEGAIRSFAGGIGAIVKDANLDMGSRLPYDTWGQSGLNGSSWAAADPKNPGNLPTANAISDWENIATWMKVVRSPRRPTTFDPALVQKGQQLFQQANCQGCHGGSSWTISQVFYTPDTTGSMNKSLTTISWGSAATSAGFPTALFPAATPAMQMMRYAGPKASSFDQLTCALRPVGTYNVAEADVGVWEMRSDGVTPSQGNETDGKGYNVPSLLGMGTAAPYLHGGQVRTLETLFSPTYATHYQALAPGFLDANDPNRDANVKALVAYVVSIDDDMQPVAIPQLGPNGGVLCATH